MPHYKVLKSDLTSLHMDERYNPGLTVQYKFNEWVYAKPNLVKLNYGLFVFNSLDAALEVYCAKFDRIFECEIYNILDRSKVTAFDTILVKEDFFTNDTYHELLDDNSWRLEDSVEVVEAVKLVKEIVCIK